MSKKIRLDLLLTNKEIFESIEQAKRAIMAGIVTINGIKRTKPGETVPIDCTIDIKEKQKYVSRGGDKLEKAINEFNICVKDKICIDMGASTGGFTDCLLQHGAKKVYAVDVGYGQIAYKFREHPQVDLREKINARYSKKEDFSPAPSLATIDVSFISLDKIIPPLLQILDSPCEIIALIKPQFEAAKEDVGAGGIIKDPEIHQKCITKIKTLATTLGLAIHGLCDSPILGAKGNKEFLIYLSMPS